jgi:hypothetical protein
MFAHEPGGSRRSLRGGNQTQAQRPAGRLRFVPSGGETDGHGDYRSGRESRRRRLAPLPYAHGRETTGLFRDVRARDTVRVMRHRVPIALWAPLLAVGGGCGGAIPRAATKSTIQLHVAQAHARKAVPTERLIAPPGRRRVAFETCAPARVGVWASTDRRLYRAGQRVLITVTVRNDTRSSCAVPTGSCLPQVLIRADNGIVVWNRAELQVLCTYRGGRRLRPGGTRAQVVSWNGEDCAGRTPMSCPGGPVRPGSYRALATWNSLTRASTRFSVGS